MASSGNTSRESQPVQGKVRWRRFAVMLVPSAIVAAALIGLTATGVLAASISVSGQAFTVKADQLQGSPFAQYGAQLPTSQGTKLVAVSVLGNASLTNLCQSISLGPIALRITAGNGGTAASASNMVVAADHLQGDATFSNIIIGQDAGQMGVNGAYPPPTAGSFGQMADSVTINNLNQNTYLTTAGTFKLPNLNLGFGNPC